MGAPVQMSLDMRITPWTTVLLGKRVSLKDVPSRDLVPNHIGCGSDPNFVGAGDHETICYRREIVVEVEKYLHVATVHPPALFGKGRRRVTLGGVVYEPLKFDVPRGKRTKRVIQAAYRKQVRLHEGWVVSENRRPPGKAMIYLATLSFRGPGPVAEAVPSYEVLPESSALEEIQDIIRQKPPGMYRGAPIEP